MSSTRNKRKRPEIDGATIAPASRRRSREQRATSSETASVEEKNEGGNKKDAQASGESSTKSTQIRSQRTRTESPSRTLPLDENSETDSSKPQTSAVEDLERKSPAAAEALEDPGSSSSEQEVTTTKKALHISENLNEAATASNGTGVPGDTREARIQKMIAHRSLLLERIRLCRSVAEKRLENDVKPDQTPGEKVSRTQAVLTDEAEIAAFHDMTKLASQAAKKSRSDGDATAEKRTSLTLRRGTSVGKRMNAALVTLAPGSNTNASSDFSSTNLPVNSLGMSKNSPKIGQGVPTANVKSNLSQIQSAAQRISGGVVHQQSLSTNKGMKASTPKISQIPKQPMSIMQDAKFRAPNSKHTKSISSSNSRPSSSSRSDAVMMPLHVGASSAILPINRLVQPKVNFPEAHALREKRERVSSRLQTLLERQQVRVVDGSKIADDFSRKTLATKKVNKEEITRAMQLEKRLPSQFPRRRKTHWDSLLQEMRWMATDYIEERKWKMSSARTVASAIPTTGLTAVKVPASRGFEKKQDSDVVAGVSSETKVPTMEFPKSREKQTERAKKKFTKKPKQVERRQYLVPSMEDSKVARKVGKILSAMVFELGSAVMNAGSMGCSDESHKEGLERYLQAKFKLTNETNELDSEKKGESSQEIANAQNSTLESEKKAESSEESVEEERSKEALSFEAITEHVEKISKLSGRARNKVSTKEMSHAMEAEKLCLSATQRETIEFIERLWGANPSTGAILAGTAASGKTLATCSLLWKQKSKGPQLLICPPTGVIRWRHEIGRFANVRVLTFGLTGGISSPEGINDDIVDFESGDVVICENSLLNRLLDFIEKETITFHSIVVDCRHPAGLLGSIRISSEKDTRSEDLYASEKWDCSPELVSVVWWEMLIKLLSRHVTCRLLIEYPELDIGALPRSGLGDRQQLELLAFRTAFVVGPELFLSAQFNLQRRVLSWARQKGKKSIANKVSRVRHVLCKAVEPLCFNIVEPGVSATNYRWDVRRCSMNSTQRDEYDRCCVEVRGSLSSCLADPNITKDSTSRLFRAASSSLLRLRRLCFHSMTREVISGLDVRSRIGALDSWLSKDLGGQAVESGMGSLFLRKICDSPAQPDAGLAFDLMNGSAKLRELASILKDEGGYQLYGEEAFKSLLEDGKRTKGTKSDQMSPKKIAILAVLPEIQLLTSLLLNSLGIKNELMHRIARRERRCAGIHATSDNQFIASDQHEATAIAWAEYQTTLSRFNAEEGCDGRGRDIPTSIVIASPACLSTWNNGLGIDRADLIISLDDDWTGRGLRMLESLVCRWHTSRSQIGRPGSLFRLVCEDTLEDKLVRDWNQTKKSLEDDKLWPLDASGFLTLPEKINTTLDLYDRAKKSSESFPAMKLMRLRGKLLSETLVPSIELPPLFGTGSPVRFLPQAVVNGSASRNSRTESIEDTHKEREVTAEVTFIKELIRFEGIASVQNRTSGEVAERIPSDANGSELYTAPPPLSLFPKHFMTRQDLLSVTTRWYLEKLRNFSVWTHPTVALGSTPLAKLPAQSTNGPSSVSNVAPPPGVSTSSELADAWHKSGLSSKPDDLASSLLFYRARRSERNLDEARDLVTQSIDDKQTSALVSEPKNPIASKRFNLYAKLYSTFWDGDSVRDGNQGCEPLVFFPPLFPNLLSNAVRETQVPGSRLPSKPGAATLHSLAIKRKEPETSESGGNHSSKRIRFHEQQPIAKADDVATVQNANGLPAPSVPVSGATIPNLENEVSETTDSMKSSVEENMEMPLITEGGETSGTEPDNEDFGLLGAGLLPNTSESVLFSAQDTTSIDHSRWLPMDNRRDFSSLPLPCDLEEVEDSSLHGLTNNLGSMILFVKKERRIFGSSSDSQGQVYRHSLTMSPAENRWARNHSLSDPMPTQAAGNSFKELNGDDKGKKGKKKGSGQGSTKVSSGFTRHPGADFSHGRPHSQVLQPNMLQLAFSKDSHRHRLLASFVSRQFGTRLTMFESTSYRVAATQVLQRVAERSYQSQWKSSLSYEVGSGLPLKSAQEPITGQEICSNAVMPLKANCRTGDAAKVLSSSQRSALRRSLASPCRVDFGACAGGFLSSPSGMTGISPPRSRLGVSLPMGVKVPQAVREPQPSWSTQDDHLLQDGAVRFGMNWILIARALSGFEEVLKSERSHVSSNAYIRSLPRSARQCRDRWQALARSQPALANEVRKSERVLRESALMRTGKIPENQGKAIILGTSVFDHAHSVSMLSKPTLLLNNPEQEEADVATDTRMDIDAQQDVRPDFSTKTDANTVQKELKEDCTNSKAKTAEGVKSRLSLTALSAMKTKRQFIPLTIPGVVTGSPSNQPVPSHPSHMKSVQASVAAQWASGRTEMWPLQILDFADKQRAASRTSNPKKRPVESAKASSGSSRRQPTKPPARRTPPSHPAASRSSFPPVPASTARSNSHRNPSSLVKKSPVLANSPDKKTKSS